MANFFEVLVGAARRTDDTSAQPRGGNQGELIVGELNPLYFEQTMRGNGFIYSTTTAASVTALGNNIPSLWNPAGSGKLIVIHKVTLQVAAVGTPAVSGFQYGYLANAGSVAATASPVLTFTHVAPVSLNISGNAGSPSIARWAPAVCTFTTAPALLGAVGVNLGSTATQTPWTGTDDVNGRIILSPGGLLQIGASTATSTTFNVSIWGLEVPLPLIV